MHPVLFEFTMGDGVWVVTAYRFFGLAACLYAAVFLYREGRRYHLSHSRCWILAGGTGVAFFTGARLLYGLISGPEFLFDPERMLSLRLRHFAFIGGAAAATAAAWLLTRREPVPFARLCDRMAPHAGIAAALFKTGCFLNGCCFGARTTLFTGYTFPRFSPAHLAQIQARPTSLFGLPQPVHPTQLYEIATALLAAAVAGWMLRRKHPAGFAAATFILIFASGRMLTFFTRDFADHPMPILWIQGPLLYAGVMLLALLWMQGLHRRAVYGASGTR